MNRIENRLQFMTPPPPPPRMIINIYAHKGQQQHTQTWCDLQRVCNRNLVRKMGLGHHLVKQFMKKKIHLADMKNQNQCIADSIMKEKIYISALN